MIYWLIFQTKFNCRVINSLQIFFKMDDILLPFNHYSNKVIIMNINSLGFWSMFPSCLGRIWFGRLFFKVLYIMINQTNKRSGAFFG
jgi:hypothetical protein